ncbi:MAG: adenylosuccinate synthetase [Patescibacteria group bacterium]|nr:adenylosuccinate synthetase [Patescibacteria group bacterium]MDD5164717.1 adenylosuccinate synthetase [Patescibacteria group bacterium]MDD5534193.1 adenylosuccinate synthetase [Patescibacteria group bacterium]
MKNNKVSFGNKKSGKATVLVGIQYGDEGKARVLDYLLKHTKYDVVARFNGGANAGHTLEANGIRIALHQVPSGIFYKKMILYYGSGCVLEPIKFNREIKEINSHGLNINNRLIISPNVPLVKPSDIIYDKIYGAKIGTTGNGIGPAYADVALRMESDIIRNIRIGDYLSNPLKFKNIINKLLINAIKWSQIKDMNIQKAVDDFDYGVKKLKKFVSKDPLVLQKMAEGGKNIFFEGANSIMLDPIYGTVPYVTSSRTVAGAAYVGGDLSNKFHQKTVAVVKAIMSRVGNGPFVSEFGGSKSEIYCAEDGGMSHTKEEENIQYSDPKRLLSKSEFEIGVALRILGGEYGATTKRPRRIGIFDLVMIKHNARLSGVDEIFINKIDCLEYFNHTKLPGIPVVVAYKLGKKIIDFFPSSEEELRKTKPVIKYLPFIKQDLSEIKLKNKLPKEVLFFIKFVENETGLTVSGIGVGPKRDQFILM